MGGLSQDKPNYKLVKSKVADVIKTNFITSPPVNAKELATYYGLTIKFANFSESMSNTCGFLDINEAAIYVNAKDSVERQNFTIAHELGHWLLHRDKITSNPASYQILMRHPIGGESDYMEKEANVFAANLLVPVSMLDVCKKAGFTNRMMGNLFVVSESVIGFRLQNEGL